MSKRIKNILFDLDGTLTNSKVGIINSILYALKKMNINEDNINELDTFLGPPLHLSFKNRYHLSDDLTDKAITYYREYFSDKGLFENSLYPGVAYLLEFLVSEKYQLFLATSKPTVYAEKILKHFKLDKYFTAIVGSNLDNSHSDKTEIISSVLTRYNLKAEQSVMIGDRKFDIVGAKNNALQSIGVTYGFGSLEELNLHEPEFMANDCSELQALIMN
ncbi:MAG: HAD family hydrolase [Salinivirgaceae bacterium]|nr:HAD family hydrolase [Salinivirgaceae bacterium]